MIERLRTLLAVREAHLATTRSELARRAQALAIVDLELAAVDDELRLIAHQRSAWERGWQSWLREDGMLRRGQEYKLFHLRLAAWENEQREQRAEVDERHRAALAAVAETRAVIVKEQLRVDVLQRELVSMRRRLQLSRVNLIESRAGEDRVPGRVVRSTAS